MAVRAGHDDARQSSVTNIVTSALAAIERQESLTSASSSAALLDALVHFVGTASLGGSSKHPWQESEFVIRPLFS